MTEPETDGWVSSFRPPTPYVPLLPRECRTHLRRLNADGTWEVLPNPHSADLLKHAERFGSDCIAETAAEYMGEEGLTALIGRLDVLDLRRGEKAAAGRLITRKAPKLKPADVRARALLGIPEEETE